VIIQLTLKFVGALAAAQGFREHLKDTAKIGRRLDRLNE
jgi:hypothetical protein